MKGKRIAVFKAEIGKYAHGEFDAGRHPGQLPQIYAMSQLRPEIVDDESSTKFIDGLSRAEVAFSPDLVQWMSHLLTSSE